jgi:hypothetical protein
VLFLYEVSNQCIVMKQCISICFVFFYFACHAQVHLNELRTSLLNVQSNKEYAFKLYNTLQSSSLTTVETGYLGLVESILATHTNDPIKKISYFNAGKSYLENSILKLPNNTELRYLRLILQLNVPKIMGYTKNIETDRSFIIKTIASQKNELGNEQYHRIIDILIKDGDCSNTERTQLQKLNRE